MKIKNQIEIDADETRFQTLYTQSQVRNNTEYLKWNWEAILEIIEHYLSNERRFQEVLKNRFLRRVLGFFVPSKKDSFVFLEWTNDRNFVMAKTGYLLI